MELIPLPPSPPTLTLTLNSNIPPDIPPDPSISMLFPENTPYRVPDNPFRGPTSKGLSETYKKALQDALGSVRRPFLFNPVEPYSFDGTCVGVDTSSDSFNSTVTTVIAAIERGYCSNRDPAPLGPSDWARLSSTLLAAVGRGYHRQYTPNQETALEKVRAEATDPNPLLSAYPTYFHRLGATAEEVAFNLGADAGEETDGYQDWYSALKNKFTKKATKAAAAEVDEKWLVWKANQLDRLAATFQLEIGEKARERGTSYFIESAERLGLQVTREGTPIDPIPAPTAGRKHTALGSTPKLVPLAPPTPSAPSTPSTPKASRINPPRAAKRTTSSPAPRGRVPTLVSQPTPRVDPSPTPRPGKKIPTPPTTLRPQPDEVDATTLTVTVLTKILARLLGVTKSNAIFVTVGFWDAAFILFYHNKYILFLHRMPSGPQYDTPTKNRFIGAVQNGAKQCEAANFYVIHLSTANHI
ncbi:hypothetical protein F5888DRAFT_1744919 [Russula emetica]|nr:hypothetical protein F5888DRAFT_1744919 [Russula emetica]